MLFLTNRFLNEGPTPINEEGELSELPRNVSFAKDNRVDQSIYFCRRNSFKNYTEIGHVDFFAELKNSNHRDVLFYIHGFNTQPEDAFKITEKLQSLFEQKSLDYVVVVPLIWPSGEQVGIVRDYFDDQKAADASEFAFMRLIEKFFAWREEDEQISEPCPKRINILAHSMGNRVLRGAIKKVVQYYQTQGMPLIFRNIFMVAADVVNETLELGQEGEFISQATRNVVVYYAADDLALRSSKVANVKNAIASRRLGHTGPENMARVPKNVYAVDCDDFNNDYDSPIGHTYFMSKRPDSLESGLLFDHLWECIKGGRIPSNNQVDLRRQILS
jgi:esterase/lipase superfamily enzyme